MSKVILQMSFLILFCLRLILCVWCVAWMNICTMSMVHTMDMDVPCACLVHIEVTGSPITGYWWSWTHCVSARNHTVSSLRTGRILKTESSLQTSILQLMKKPRINLFFLWTILVNWKFSLIIAHNYISQLCYWLVVWLNFQSFLILNLLIFKMKFNHNPF